MHLQTFKGRSPGILLEITHVDAPKGEAVHVLSVKLTGFNARHSGGAEANRRARAH